MLTWRFIMDFANILRNGTPLNTSGTTGPAKVIFQGPKKLAAGNLAAITSQKIARTSKIYTVCSLDHAGGLLAQTLPAYSIGADVTIEPFNAYRFMSQIHKYTHTHLTPGQCSALFMTKAFFEMDFTGIHITCGSDRVYNGVIRAFVERGATFMTNWGMTEVGPCAINATFNNMDDVENAVSKKGYILGNKKYCNYIIQSDNELVVKGDISVHGNTWFNTGDLVFEANSMIYYKGRL